MDARHLVPTPRRVDVREEHGRLIITRRKFGPVRSALARMLRQRPIFEVRLDVLGSAVWRLIDGQRDAAAILAALRQSHPAEPELPARLGAYLSTMASQRLIRLD